MDGKVFCYTERSEFLVAGDNTVLDEDEKVH
jgi:hypothetical protein